MQSLMFCSQFSSLQCHMIFQKSFQYADLLHKSHLLLLAILKTVVLLNCFVSLTVTFDQFIVSLLNKSIYLFQMYAMYI